MSLVGHNGGPALAPRAFKRRWATAIFSCPDKPMGAVAMAFKLYMEMGADGTGAVISDRDFADACGVSERACQNFKRWLLSRGFVSIQVRGHKGRPNMFRAEIPGLTAPDAVNEEEYQAPIAGNNPHYRHPLPENQPTSTAPHADDHGLTAPDAGNPSPRVPPRARIESPSGILPFETEDTNKPNKLGKGGVGEKPSLPETKRAPARRKPTIEQFERFWAVYPLRKGKPKAIERFMVLTPEQAERAILAAQAYASECVAKGIEDRYRKWPQGWLSERRFEDEIPDPNESLVSPDGKKRWGWWRGKEVAMRAIPRERWHAAYEKARPNGTWPWWDMTPAPGHPESCFPEDLANDLNLIGQYPDGVNHG
jgi:hypothetical protein